jgi:hypothetical protein
VLLVRPVQTLAAFGIFLFAAGAAGARSSLWIYRIPEGVANRAIRWMARVSLALAATTRPDPRRAQLWGRLSR